MRSMRKAALRTLLLSCCMALPNVALAQDAAEEEESLEDIVITGEIQYRNRTDTVAPELVYDQQFFEQFEPLSVGDQLSRVPGVAFTSDIGERDAPQMRSGRRFHASVGQRSLDPGRRQRSHRVRRSHPS